MKGNLPFIISGLGCGLALPFPQSIGAALLVSLVIITYQETQDRRR